MSAFSEELLLAASKLRFPVCVNPGVTVSTGARGIHLTKDAEVSKQLLALIEDVADADMMNDGRPRDTLLALVRAVNGVQSAAIAKAEGRS